jgi:ABC-type transporter Mla subunit MlaD
MSEKKSAVVEATEALDHELARVEHLCESAGRVPLSTRRNLEKAARTVAEAAQVQLAVGERIGALMAALTAVRERNEKTVAGMQTLSDEIRRRSEELGALLERFDQIGAQAGEVSALVATVTPSAETGARLKELETRLGTIAESAKTLWDDAGRGGWSDVQRDAESLRQQVLAAKNKLSLTAQKLAGRLEN